LHEIIGVSSISLISQSFGQKDIEKNNIAIEQTISFKFLVVTIGSIVLLVLLKPIMNFLLKKLSLNMD